MLKFITLSISKWLWPDLTRLPKPDQFRLMLDLSGVIFYLPWLVFGFGWLVYLTDLSLIIKNWPLFLLILILSMVLNRLPFFMFVNIRGRSSYNSSNLTDIVLISGIFLFGPTGIWIVAVSSLFQYLIQYITASRAAPVIRPQRWNWLRNLIFNLGVSIFAFLCGLSFYSATGGQFPLSGRTFEGLFAAVLAILVYWLISSVLMIVWWLLVYWADMMKELVSQDSPTKDRDNVQVDMARHSLIFLILTSLPSVFGILAALIYSNLGLLSYMFFYLAILLASLLTRRMSSAVLVSQQKSRELDQLERLGRAILASPMDASSLPKLLTEYVPKMMAYKQIEIQLINEPSVDNLNKPVHYKRLLQLPEDRPNIDSKLWSYFWDNPVANEFVSGEKLPWSDDANPDQYLLIPIKSEENNKTIGGICLTQENNLFLNINTDLMPALQVLAAQIASALHSEQVFKRTLEYQKTSQELSFAGEIQTSFLPRLIPEIQGWSISTMLDSARDTYGDFFDLIELPDDRLGIIIADVTDKGMGAALFMALSRTLLRTYALEYPDDPARVMAAANTRILKDAETGLFVTVFYGVLNTITGELIYVNAGHNPPFWLRTGLLAPGGTLKRTGMAIGVMEGEVWENRRHQIEPDDILVFYTDGIPEAQNPVGAFYGEERFTNIAIKNSDRTAREIKDAVIQDLENFVDSAPQADDITLLVLKRIKSNE